jgi:hypothetical protein
LNTTLKFWTDLGENVDSMSFSIELWGPFSTSLREYRGNIMSDVYLPCNQSINTKLSLFSLSLSLSLVRSVRDIVIKFISHSVLLLPGEVYNFIIKIESVKIVYWFINNYLRKKEIIVAFYHLNTTSGTFQERSDRD